MSWVRIPHRPVNRLRKPLVLLVFPTGQGVLHLPRCTVAGCAERFGRVPQRRSSAIGGGSSIKVRIENLKVVLLRDPFAVAQPCRDDMTRKRLRQFGLTRASQVVPRAGSCDESRPLDDLAEHRPEIHRPPVTGCRSRLPH